MPCPRTEGHPAFQRRNLPKLEPLCPSVCRTRRTEPALLVELLATGRTAEVFAYGEGRVLKLDRPEWNGLSIFEETVLRQLAEAGLPVARPHGTRTVDGRDGVVLDRVDGPSLLQVLTTAGPEEIDHLADQFVGLQLQCNETHVAGLPELVPRLGREVEASVPDKGERTDLLSVLGALDNGGNGICHFDFHPSNVLVGPEGWVVIDWLTVATGPSAADLARTLVLWGQRSSGPVGQFLRAVRRQGRARRGLPDDALDAWIRVVAAARLAEGFEGEERMWLVRVARGGEQLFA
jgi:Ser/Thr protein kinase RdoA (MazF antagonist)